jgi:hypothetical protein
MGSEDSLGVRGGDDGVGGAREDAKEGVALSVDFDAMMSSHCLSEETAMVGKRVGVAITESVE